MYQKKCFKKKRKTQSLTPAEIKNLNKSNTPTTQFHHFHAHKYMCVCV
jgi:hypothetical protein